MTKPKRKPHPGPAAYICRCAVPDGRLWCWRCSGSVKLTADETARLIRESSEKDAKREKVA